MNNAPSLAALPPPSAAAAAWQQRHKDVAKRAVRKQTANSANIVGDRPVSALVDA